MDFRAKLGPLPVWAWGLIFGGLAVVWLWVSGRQTKDYSESITGEQGNLEIAPGSDFSTVPVMPVGETGTSTEGDTNDDWLRRAVAAVMNSGVSTLAAQRAIQKYLSGEALTTAEQGIVNKAITETGLPPDGTSTPVLEPEKAAPKPKTPAKPKPKNYQTVTSISAPSSAKYGAPIPTRVTVKWKDSRGHSTPPGGRVVLTKDGKKYTRRLYAGQAVISFGSSRKGKRAKDGIFIIAATYQPWKSSNAKGSSAPPKTVRLK